MKDAKRVTMSLRALKKICTATAEYIPFFREFDPGSGRTLAACLTHASRTELDAGLMVACYRISLFNLVADG